MRWLLCGAAALVAAGCSSSGGNRPERPAGDLDSAIAGAERAERESGTLSSLAALQRSVDDYYHHEGKVPDKLDALVPKYLAEIPVADTGARRHRAAARVTYYPAAVIRDGVVDGTRLKDTGGWGYVFNGRQAILFVDCTHPNSRQRPWYKEIGAVQWERGAPAAP